jgi:hypothetical protein
MKTVRIAAAQTVEFKEDIEAALNCVTDIAARAESEDASLLCFPESFLQGYLTDETPARRNALDLSSPAFEAVLNRLPKAGPMIVIGLTEVEEGRLFNTAIVMDRGILIGRYRKDGTLRRLDCAQDTSPRLLPHASLSAMSAIGFKKRRSGTASGRRASRQGCVNRSTDGYRNGANVGTSKKRTDGPRRQGRV